MKITAGNKYGGKNNDHMTIELESRSDFCILETALSAFLVKAEGHTYGEGTTYDKAVKLSKELRLMMHPMNDKPKRYFEIKH